MTARTTSRIAWGLFTLGLATFGIVLYIESLTGRATGHSIPGGSDVVFLPVFLSFAGVGALVVSRQPGNPVGWSMLLPFALPLGLLAGAWANYGLTQAVVPASAARAGVLFEMSIGVFTLPLVLTLLLFPHGELPSRRWRVVIRVAVATTLANVISTAVADVNFHNNFPRLEHPLQLFPASTMQGVYDASQLVSSLLFVVAAASLVVRYRRAVGDERAQIKWVTFGAAVFGVGYMVLALVAPFGLEPVVAFIVLVPLIPIGAGVGILKYRLYDIDIVINKTLVFGTLALFITAVYVGIVVGVGALIGSAGSSPALSIAATAIVAVAFQPARERARRFANRLVYGKRSTPYEVLSEFSERLGGTYADEDLLPRMARILAEGTGAARADVWIVVGGELRASATWPADVEAQASIAVDRMPDELVQVRHQGQLLGALSVEKKPGETLTPTEDKLIHDLAAQAGLVLRNVGLSKQLLARLDDLKASRQRLVAAQDEERRKIERNIHDGAQQQLVALSVKLKLLSQLTARDPEKAIELADQLQTEATDALENLRDLARGIYPPLLADKGLVAALESQARKTPMQVVVRADGIERFDQDTEAAVYFSCLEALQNVAKYAEATSASVSLSQGNGDLRFEVTDDGRGFDPSQTGYGTGLQGIADRVAALGGDLEVRSIPGEGTTVAGRLPVERVLT